MYVIENLWRASIFLRKGAPLYIITCKTKWITDQRGQLQRSNDAMNQARSQPCVAEVAKFSRRNHVVQYLRSHFMLYAIKVKWVICVQGKNEVLSMWQTRRLSSIKISWDLSLAAKKSSKINCKNIFPGVAKSWFPVTQGWHMPPHTTPWLRACLECKVTKPSLLVF